MSAARAASFAGLSLDKPRLMGVLNVTPDSFSDGGDFIDAERAIAHGRALAEAGADIVDVGGESTRPGAAPVPEEEELRRVLPVIEALVADGTAISIDTRHAGVMRRALAAGARIVNDVSALTTDPAGIEVVAEAGTPVILMHMQGEPGTMQDNPAYDDAAIEVRDYLLERAATLQRAGVAAADIALDPGIGFGKNIGHNLDVLARLDLYRDTGHPVVLGVSRKSMISRLDRDVPPKQRVPGSIAAALAGRARGVQIFRVHDVAETRQAFAVWEAIANAAAD